MALRTRTRAAIALLGATMIVSLCLFTTRDRTTRNNESSHMISNEVKWEKRHNLEMGTENNRNLEVPKNTLTELLESVKSLKKAFKTMQMAAEEKEMQQRIERHHNQLGDAHGQVSTPVNPSRVWCEPAIDVLPLNVVTDAKCQGSFTDYRVVAGLVSLEVMSVESLTGAVSALYRDWEKPPEYTCGKMEKRGSWHICNDNNFEVKPPCLVYSFGIWKDWSFDDAMGALGCEVHSFDPSLGLKPFDRSENVHFHDLALSNRDSDTYVPPKDRYVKTKTTWKIRRLKTIMEMLGHTDRHLDVLKIDIETSEWPAVKDIAECGLFSKVRQFSVEWHLFPTHPNRSEYINCYTSAMAMKEQGLRTFRTQFHKQNYEEKTFRLQADVNYVNILHKET